MKLGINQIGSFIPSKKHLNLNLNEKDEKEIDFIKNKIGFISVAKKDENQETSDLAVNAFLNLQKKNGIDINVIDCLIVCTQNPDSYGLPHTSSIIHKKLGLSSRCAAFDFSLGCSGYVYGLSIIKSFMESNNLKNGLLFTSDPYSKIINGEDRNTSLLFGDAATVTLINDNPIYFFDNFLFGTNGQLGDSIQKNNKNILEMNGRAVFNFTATVIPDSINEYLKKNNLEVLDIDLFILHQGSKFIVETINKKLNLSIDKSPFLAESIGNTVSSSIPLILESKIENKSSKILISGFGVGLSWATTLLKQAS